MFTDFFYLMTERFNPFTQGTAVNFTERDLVLHDGLDKPGIMNVISGQGFPFARILRHVGDEQVGVQLRIKVAGCVMRIGGGHHPAGVHDGRDAVFRVARRNKLLHIAGCHTDGMVVRFHHFFIVADQGQYRDTFGGRKGQVMAGTVNVLTVNLLAKP